jgi:hypothetical protein
VQFLTQGIFRTTRIATQLIFCANVARPLISSFTLDEAAGAGRVSLGRSNVASACFCAAFEPSALRA